MKKFLYLAIMALTVGFFASCKSGSNGSDYYKDGKEPQIDYNNATVNGKKYDNQKEKCWCWTMKATVVGVTSSTEEYLGGTEFDLVAACEAEMYAFSLANKILDAKASYTYIQTSDQDPEECHKHNDKNGSTAVKHAFRSTQAWSNPRLFFCWGTLGKKRHMN